MVLSRWEWGWMDGWMDGWVNEVTYWLYREVDWNGPRARTDPSIYE